MHQHSPQACLVAVARGIDIDVHRAKQVSIDAPSKVNAISQSKEGSHCLVRQVAATGHDVPSELLVGIAGRPPRDLCFGELESPAEFFSLFPALREDLGNGFE